MCSLRYTARTSPCGSTCTEVLASFSPADPKPVSERGRARPAAPEPAAALCRRSTSDPATRSIESSRASARAHETAGPSSVSAPARRYSSAPRTVHFSGSTINRAPSAAAARVRRSAAAMFAAVSAVELSWTAATLISAFPSMSVPPQNRLTSQSTSPSIAPAGPIPPASMPLLRGTRPLKRWRYVGVFCEELMACAATVRVGPAHQAFWAVVTREDLRLRERTHTLARRGTVRLAPGRMRVHDGGVALDLALREEVGVEALCPHGGGYVWTRKQAGIAASGTVSLDGGSPRAIEALAVVDDTAGYHARATEWHWAAGVGVDPDGTPLAFNLVEGVNDPPCGSERAVWVAGEPHEAAPVRFAADLSRIESDDGAVLHFAAEAQRSRRENLLLVRS